MTAWRDYAHAARIELRLRGWDKDTPEPCAEAREFAIMEELASRIGMDWADASDLLIENATSYEDEAEHAREEARRLTDKQLLRALHCMIAEQNGRRAQLAAGAA